MAVTVHPSQADFARTYDAGTPQLVYAKMINDLDTPVSAFIKIADTSEYAFLFESVTGGEQRGRYSILGLDPDIVWSSQGEQASLMMGEENVKSGRSVPIDGKPLDTLRNLLSQSAFKLPHHMPPMAAGLFGYLGYDMVRHIEHLPNDNIDPIGTPDGLMIRPTIVAIFDQIAQEIILTAPVYPDPNADERVDAGTAYDRAVSRIRDAEIRLKDSLLPDIKTSAPITDITPVSPISRAEYSKRVERARDYIESGDAFQIVIGHRFSAPLNGSPLSLYRALRRMNPSPFLYYLKLNDHYIVGSSPEILVRLRDGTVTIRPIAGTRPRGATPHDDIANEKSLLNDPKERAEHLMLLDLGRNDVGRVAQSGTVEVTEKFVIERYSHVMHIVSNVEGAIKPTFDALSALFAGFPAGTVSGAPKVRAMEIIDELETEKRGIYGGAVGYISCEGEMDTAIALRTGIIKDGILHVRAGAGIVADSQPDYEYDETVHKAAALFRAAEQSIIFGEA